MLELAGFPMCSRDKVRYADTDRQGHVNNALFATFLETGRVEILYDPASPLAAEGAEFVIASLQIDFVGEITWPGEVAIGTGVRKVGNASLTLTQAVFQADRCVARAETVIVQIDRQSRRSSPLSDATRARLQQLQVVAAT